ncbi:hypothetical protein MRB53_028680 [Persea americana]|uniref:Uncharacterized protein n=1 Tax=Persea americana TaxID=3435 RepID=A0ACC2KGL5_PERAE|nr:hypothetical protein MRB53_028680 [Persea americana]
MTKGSKTYVKPGWVAKQAKLTEYEKVRSKNIMEIDERCRALGVKHMANTVFGLGQTSRRKNGEGKRTLSEDDDNEEYRPPQGDFGLVSSDENTGDDGDDETSGYPANMVTHMIREKRSRHACVVAAALAQATPAHPPLTRSSRAENTPEGAGQATPAQPRVTQSSHVDSMPEVATIARARSLTQIGSSSGHPDQLGHAIPISIPASSRAPEGEFATSFANWLEEAIRDEAPVRKEGWKFVPKGIKKLVIKRVQEKSKKARVSRSKMPWNHTSGSRSFLARSSMIQIADFGKKTILLEGLVLQLAERAGIDPGSLVGEDGTSSRAQDATSLGF